jgi:hypothetical protein
MSKKCEFTDVSGKCNNRSTDKHIFLNGIMIYRRAALWIAASFSVESSLLIAIMTLTLGWS